MPQSPLPSLRIILFSNQPPPLVNALVEAMGQQVFLVVTTPGTRSRPNENYHRIVASARRDLDVLVTETERNLDWNRSAVQLRNQVRAWGSQGRLPGLMARSISRGAPAWFPLPLRRNPAPCLNVLVRRCSSRQGKMRC